MIVSDLIGPDQVIAGLRGGSKEAVLLRLLDGVEADVITPIVETLCDSEGSARNKLVQFVHQHAVLGLTNREDLLLLISMSIEFAEQTGEASARNTVIKEEVLAAITDEQTCLINALGPQQHEGQEPSGYARPGRRLPPASRCSTARRNSRNPS